MSNLAFVQCDPTKRRNATRIAESEWNRCKRAITSMHEQRILRTEMLQILKDKFRFTPSSGQLHAKMAKWGLTVYTPRGKDHAALECDRIEQGFCDERLQKLPKADTPAEGIDMNDKFQAMNIDEASRLLNRSRSAEDDQFEQESVTGAIELDQQSFTDIQKPEFAESASQQEERSESDGSSTTQRSRSSTITDLSANPSNTTPLAPATTINLYERFVLPAYRDRHDSASGESFRPYALVSYPGANMPDKSEIDAWEIDWRIADFFRSIECFQAANEIYHELFRSPKLKCKLTTGTRLWLGCNFAATAQMFMATRVIDEINNSCRFCRSDLLKVHAKTLQCIDDSEEYTLQADSISLRRFPYDALRLMFGLRSPSCSGLLSMEMEVDLLENFANTLHNEIMKSELELDLLKHMLSWCLRKLHHKSFTAKVPGSSMDGRRLLFQDFICFLAKAWLIDPDRHLTHASIDHDLKNAQFFRFSACQLETLAALTHMIVDEMIEVHAGIDIGQPNYAYSESACQAIERLLFSSSERLCDLFEQYFVKLFSYQSVQERKQQCGQISGVCQNLLTFVRTSRSYLALEAWRDDLTQHSTLLKEQMMDLQESTQKSLLISWSGSDEWTSDQQLEKEKSKWDPMFTAESASQCSSSSILSMRALATRISYRKPAVSLDTGSQCSSKMSWDVWSENSFSKVTGLK